MRSNLSLIRLLHMTSKIACHVEQFCIHMSKIAPHGHFCSTDNVRSVRDKFHVWSLGSLCSCVFKKVSQWLNQWVTNWAVGWIARFWNMYRWRVRYVRRVSEVDRILIISRRLLSTRQLDFKARHVWRWAGRMWDVLLLLFIRSQDSPDLNQALGRHLPVY